MGPVMEYTWISVLAILVSYIADRKLGTGVYSSRNLIYVIAFLFCMQIIFDQIVIMLDLVQYRASFITGLFLGYMPIEDFLFGWAMFAWTFIMWEYFNIETGEEL